MDERDKTPRRAVGDWSFLLKLIGALALAGFAQALEGRVHGQSR